MGLPNIEKKVDWRTKKESIPEESLAMSIFNRGKKKTYQELGGLPLSKQEKESMD